MRRTKADNARAKEIARKECILKRIQEWHLDTFLEPLNPNFVIHEARMQGFLAGIKTRIRLNGER